MKVTIKGFVHKDKYDDEFIMYPHDMSSYGYLLVGGYQFDFEIPASFNPVALEIAALKKKSEKLSDEYMQQIGEIKRRISELTCIENGVAA